MLEKKKINIACVKKTRWVGDKARNVDKFKLWYSGRVGGRNRVGILVDKDLREVVVEVRRVNDRLMSIKLVVGGFTLNIISAYAPQTGLDEEVKRRFWEEEISTGTLERRLGEYDNVHGGFGFGNKNGGGMSLLDFSRAFELVIANSSFPKKKEHLVTFRSSLAETQIDYLLYRKFDRGVLTDCKVISSENLSTLHRLLVMNLEITRKRRKRAMYSQNKIKWGALTEAKA
uniref:Craniofacial development protein 2-like n=1 Tax=Nicotiana tabacum TaxID=4097 RepID=A0A1S3XGM7_TOBAC|nr:PREDICTED: craniofacial development protein 2-like [Nicotiana tabacum]